MTRTLGATIGASILVSVLTLAQHGPASVVVGVESFDRRVVASGLLDPSEIAWGPDDMLWVAERSGRRITRVDPVSGERRVAVTIDEAAAPGGQEGLVGMALHPQLLRGTGHDYVYVAYTYTDRQRPPDARVTDPTSPYRHLRGKIARLRYDAASGTLTDPFDVIVGLPASNDHNAMRLAIASDGRLHLSIGDMGNGQFTHACHPIRAQELPTAEAIARQDYSAYQGKTLRIDPDGSIPADNPVLAGVVSHVFTYGHRNPQGLAFGPDGTLYSAEHGPKSDDEVNVLTAGGNYGWPHVAGRQDDHAYEYVRWSEAEVPCATLSFSDFVVPASVPRDPESAYTRPIVEPIATLFTVPTGFNFQDPACKGVHFMCWPTVATSSVEFYGGRGASGIPGWDRVLLIPTMKRGSLYVLPLDASGRRAAGPVRRYFQTQNRYRDVAVHPDGRTIYLATLTSGLVESPAGDSTSALDDRGAIIAFTYRDDAGPGEPAPGARRTAEPAAPAIDRGDVLTGPALPVTFTAAQAAEGRAGYNSYCAICHGTTLTNGTFATPLAGEFFRARWSGRSVAALYDKSRDTMPPSMPASLSRASYAAILAYVLQVNGVAAGDTALPADAATLGRMRVP